MNLITHNKAYSIFPHETFEQRRSLIHVRDAESALKARSKYETRGWRFITEIDDDEVQNLKSAFAPGSRHLGDSKCWTIPLHPELDYSPKYWEANCWGLRYNIDSSPIHMWTLIQRRLHFTYLLDVALWILPPRDTFKEMDDEQ